MTAANNINSIEAKIRRQINKIIQRLSLSDNKLQCKLNQSGYAIFGVIQATYTVIRMLYSLLRMKPFIYFAYLLLALDCQGRFKFESN